MKNDIAQGLLFKIIGGIVDDNSFTFYSKHFQTMARYKYDGYKQFAPGMRFIESLALWLKQFHNLDIKVALDFVKNNLVFISGLELDLLVSSCYQDLIKPILIKKISQNINIPEYKISRIINSEDYKILIRKSLFCGLSDGAKIDIFRRSNTGIISHEQVYLTYELSNSRGIKMQEELKNDLDTLRNPIGLCRDDKFTMLFLLDDFSASGTSYLKYNEEIHKLSGKIYSLFENIFSKDSEGGLKEIFDINNLEVHIILYLCTEQAKSNIENNIKKLYEKYPQVKKVQLHVYHLISEEYKLTNDPVLFLCDKDEYYDKEKLEDKHTGKNVRRGFGECSLPIVLYHNCPNNSISILWSYEYAKFKGLFPRIPRHREL